MGKTGGRERITAATHMPKSYPSFPVLSLLRLKSRLKKRTLWRLGSLQRDNKDFGFGHLVPHPTPYTNTLSAALHALCWQKIGLSSKMFGGKITEIHLASLVGIKR